MKKKLVLLAIWMTLVLASSTFAAMTQGIPDCAKGIMLGGTGSCCTANGAPASTCTGSGTGTVSFAVGHTFKARLYVTASTNMSIASTMVCNNTGELSGGNYAIATLTGAAVTMDTTNHYGILTFNTPTWANITAAHVDGMAICDYTADTGNGVLLAYFTFTDTPVTGGTLTITIPAVAYNTGLITVH